MSRTSRARPPGPPPRGPALAAAALAVAFALAVSDGNLHPLALALVTLGALLAGASLAGRSPLPGRASWEPVTSALLGAGLAGALAFDAVARPGLAGDPARLGALTPAVAVAAALTATHLWPGAPAVVRALRFPLLVATWLVLVGAVLRAAPAPAIDVWDVQQQGATALSDGLNPYLRAYPNGYGPGTPYLAPEFLSPDGLFLWAFPYPPLVVLADLPSALLGDVRYTHVLATAAAAVLVFLVGGRRRAAELAATFLLFQPRTLLVMELGWTEPLVLATVAGLALALARGAGLAATGALTGLALASKQYAPLLVLPLWSATPPALRRRAAALGIAIAAAIYLPFALWDARELWRGVVAFQLAQPFRLDALSWPAAIAGWGGPRLPYGPAFLAAGVIALLGAARARTLQRALAAGTLAWLVLVLWNKQAFCNYYWLAAGLLCLAVAAGEPEA